MKLNGKKSTEVKVQATGLNLWYGKNHALQNINMTIYRNSITALIGPSGCGKSTFLRCINRMNDLIDHAHIEGDIIVDGKNIYDRDVDEVAVRKRIGMVFQQPNPFPKSIYENIIYAPVKHKLVSRRRECEQLVKNSLSAAGLWEEVKSKLHTPGTALSGGQQQRLCIARALAINPDVILMDEPTSALDPISTETIESLMVELKKKYTIVIVTHNMQQATRIADHTAYFHLGKLVEYNETPEIFNSPAQELTASYISGRFG